MSEYIHSGVAGKINRIVKPHIGNILVTSEFGNAKESTLTEATLKAAVNDINRIKYAVTYKGEKATVDALPTTGNTKGDMWNVTENGHNYAWTGSEWDDLGGTAVEGNGGNSDWVWNPIPVYDVTLENAWFDSGGDFSEGYQIPATVFESHPKAAMIIIYKSETILTGSGNTTNNTNMGFKFNWGIHNFNKVTYDNVTYTTDAASVSAGDLVPAVSGSLVGQAGIWEKVSSVCQPIHGMYYSEASWISLAPVGAYPVVNKGRRASMCSPALCFDSGVEYIDDLYIYIGSNTLPAGTRLSIYIPQV